MTFRNTIINGNDDWNFLRIDKWAFPSMEQFIIIFLIADCIATDAQTNILFGEI